MQPFIPHPYWLRKEAHPRFAETLKILELLRIEGSAEGVEGLERGRSKEVEQDAEGRGVLTASGPTKRCQKAASLECPPSFAHALPKSPPTGTPVTVRL